MGRWNAVDPLAEDFYEWSPFTYVYNNPLIFVDPDGRAGNLTDGVHLYFQRDSDSNLDISRFLTAVFNYMSNVMSVWGQLNAADISNVTISVVGSSFKKGNLKRNENLVQIGQGGISHVRGRNNRIGYINIDEIGAGSNVAAHEFGHHLGLSDRYNEGVAWRFQKKFRGERRDPRRQTTPIESSEIDDINYDPQNNLYSTPRGAPVITAQQMAIASSRAKERRHQINGGYFHHLYGNNGVKSHRYRKVFGMIFVKGFRGSQRKKIKKAIKDNDG